MALYSLIAVFIVGIIAMGGFFFTKREGFGRFSTSALLLLLVVIASTMLAVAGQLEGQLLANILFAVVGFAGGLFAGNVDSACRVKV